MAKLLQMNTLVFVILVSEYLCILKNFHEYIFYQLSINYWIKHIFPAFHGMPSVMDTANLSIRTDFPASSFLHSHDFFCLFLFLV